MNKYQYLQQYINKPMSYKQLCGILEWDVKSGNSKIAQMQELQQYADIIIHGGHIIIKQLYNDSEIELKEKHGKFTTYVENLLIAELSQCTERQVNLSYKDILERLYMVNRQYFRAKNNQRQYIDDIPFNVSIAAGGKDAAYDIVEQDLRIFFSVSYKILKEIIMSALKSMRNRSLITYSESFRLYTKDVDGNIKSYDCSPKEASEILDIRYKVMQEFNLKTLGEIMYADSWIKDRYFEKVSDILYQRFGYDRYAHTIHITLGKEGLQKEYEASLSGHRLNANVQNKLLTTKELQCLHEALKEQFVDMFVKN